MRKIVLTYGLIAGAILSALMAIAMMFHDEIGFDRGLFVGYTSMVIAFLMVYFGIRTYRDEVAGGTVSFWRAFAVGSLIVAIATVCYVATWEVIYTRYMPDFVDKYSAYTIGKARESGATEAEIAKQTQKMAEFKAAYANPLVNIAMTSLEPLPIGILFTLVSAGVLSRRRRNASASQPVRDTA